MPMQKPDREGGLNADVERCRRIKPYYITLLPNPDPGKIKMEKLLQEDAKKAAQAQAPTAPMIPLGGELNGIPG